MEKCSLWKNAKLIITLSGGDKMPNRSSIMRLSRYKNALLKLKSLNFVRVFSDNLADAAGVTSAQVRKDFSMFGITGNRRGGYQVDELIEHLNRILGKDKVRDFIVVGIGHIGTALLNYRAFKKSGIRIVTGFDIDTAKQNPQADVPVLPLEKLTEFVKNNNIEYAIITVPDFAAQQVFELMLAAGIKGFLNFAPIRLRCPEGRVVNNINIETELENIIYFVNVAGTSKEQ